MVQREAALIFCTMCLHQLLYHITIMMSVCIKKVFRFHLNNLCNIKSNENKYASKITQHIRLCQCVILLQKRQHDEINSYQLYLFPYFTSPNLTAQPLLSVPSRNINGVDSHAALKLKACTVTHAIWEETLMGEKQSH